MLTWLTPSIQLAESRRAWSSDRVVARTKMDRCENGWHLSDLCE